MQVNLQVFLGLSESRIFDSLLGHQVQFRDTHHETERVDVAHILLLSIQQQPYIQLPAEELYLQIAVVGLEVNHVY